MANYVKPASWSLFRSNGESQTYVKAGHTSAAPHTVTLARSEPSARTQPAQAVSSYKVRFARGLLDTDGIPVAPKHSLALEARRAIAFSATDLDADLVELGSLLANADFRAMVINTLLFPDQVAAV
jgi:hypothetical protein